MIFLLHLKQMKKKNMLLLKKALIDLISKEYDP